MLLFMVVTMKWGRYAMHNGVKSFLLQPNEFKSDALSNAIASFFYIFFTSKTITKCEKMCRC